MRIPRTAVLLAALTVAALSFSALAAGPALAAKGGGASKVTVTIVQLGGGNPYNFGESIGFAVDGGALTAPAVVSTCSQNGEVVYGESHGIVAGFSGPFTLGPTPMWTGGAAECVAQVWETYQNAKPVRGAFVSFHVDP